MQTEGETDTGSDVDTVQIHDNRHVQMAPDPVEKTTSGGRSNLFHAIDDEKSWDDKTRQEEKDMKRQLKHYITQSNIHDVHGLPQMLKTTMSDLESGADLTDVDTAGPTMDILNVCLLL